MFSQAIKPTATNSESGTVPVTFHMEVRKESILPHAEYTLLYQHCAFQTVTKPMKFMKNNSHTLGRNLRAPRKFRGH